MSGNTDPHTRTVAQALQSDFDNLTPSERRLAAVILENYPVSGVGTITELAEAAGVSTPTVARMAQKLGFDGFPQFQSCLRRELERQFANPINKRESWHTNAPKEHIVNSFTDAVMTNIRQSLAQLDLENFEEICVLLSDLRRRIIIAGGRITHTLADYLRLHLEVMRPGVSHFPMDSNAWPHALLDLQPDDVVVIFDIRRYETTALRLAEMARERDAKIILFTDQWRSPASIHAQHVLTTSIEAPSAWDSSVAMMLLIEVIIARVQESHWPKTRARMETLEQLLDEAKLFRRFPGYNASHRDR